MKKLFPLKLTVFGIFALSLLLNESFAGNLKYPENFKVRKIGSDFESNIGINKKKRTQKHQGIDIAGPNGQLIIAVANGIVLETHIEKCWGPTIVIDHGIGLDGKKLIVLYGHVDEMLVKEGEIIKRGQIIAKLGNNHRQYKCIFGVRHLHMQIGQNYRDKYEKGNYWGWGYFIKDGRRSLNPHNYWSDGFKNITCFEKNKQFKEGTITYPVPCRKFKKNSGAVSGGRR